MLLVLAMQAVTAVVSPGPVFFRQERIGFMGRRFFLYKFRTMHLGADCRRHQEHVRDLMRRNVPMQKLDARGDARLIPGAWLLRAIGLDELPQVINVLRGEMSLVGPRPSLPEEYALYEPWQKKRCLVAPGLTGLWQVSGKNRTTFEEMMRLDLRYVRGRSPALDGRILARTIPALAAQLRETRQARRAAALRAPAVAPAELRRVGSEARPGYRLAQAFRPHADAGGRS
jgi:lipopolysaccharide/colanic/teichoic acid biosynthesis glycosyltransferase